MNRRNFIAGLLAAGAGFNLLPSARLYTRALWKPRRSMGYDLYYALDYAGEWRWVGPVEWADECEEWLKRRKDKSYDSIDESGPGLLRAR
jgi:hypothetical protein